MNPFRIMPTIERCVNQISPPIGILPGQSHAGDCKKCKYNPKENKTCPCYECTTYKI